MSEWRLRSWSHLSSDAGFVTVVPTLVSSSVHSTQWRLSDHGDSVGGGPEDSPRGSGDDPLGHLIPNLKYGNKRGATPKQLQRITELVDHSPFPEANACNWTGKAAFQRALGPICFFLSR